MLAAKLGGCVVVLLRSRVVVLAELFCSLRTSSAGVLAASSRNCASCVVAWLRSRVLVVVLSA